MSETNEIGNPISIMEVLKSVLTEVPNASACLRPFIRISPFCLVFESSLPAIIMQKRKSNEYSIQSISTKARFKKLRIANNKNLKLHQLPANVSRRVDFPQPEGPIIAKT